MDNFSIFDKSGDGQLTCQDFKDAMRAVIPNTTEAELDRMIELCGIEGKEFSEAVLDRMIKLCGIEGKEVSEAELDWMIKLCQIEGKEVSEAELDRMIELCGLEGIKGRL